MNHDFVIALAVYPGMDLMDVAAPYEIFNWAAENWPGHERTVKVWLVAETPAPVPTCDNLQLVPHKTFAEVKQVDLLWIPGGDPEALVKQMGNACYVEFIQTRAQQARYVTSVCEGALLAANAGLLDGFSATTHWAFIETLRKYYPKVKVQTGFPRFVHDGNRITGGGISSGLDEALYLVKLFAGQEAAEQVQLTTQYFPQPPVSGSIPDPLPDWTMSGLPVPPPAMGCHA